VYDVFRRRFPERTRLSKRLRYAAEHDVRLVLQTTRDGLSVALTVWPQRAPMLRVPMTDAAIMFDRDDPAEATVCLLQFLGAPVLLDHLTSFFAIRWGVDTLSRDIAGGEQSVEPDQLQRLESRCFLETLWREVKALERQHRVAVILNLREREGGNAAALFVLLGIATFEQVACALEMSVGDLDKIWNALPLDDRSIAELLKMTRQQVINLRKTARERLSRRLADFLR
jgi:hypothetical protein